jgi:hypothetical protein
MLSGNESFKENHELIHTVLKEYKERYKTRPFIKGHPEWLR